jgi:uncharacterized protein (DUF58 family)
VRRLLYAALRLFSALDHWLRERLTLAGWVVLGAAGAAGGAGLDTNRTLTYQAFAFLVALLALAYLASLAFRARVEVRRELPRYATAGETCSYRVTLTNRGRRALEGVLVGERFADPRPAFEAWRRAREPGEERRNWWDRNVGYFRWRWLIEQRLPKAAQAAELPVTAPGERQSVKLDFTVRQRGRISLTGLTLGRADPLGLVKGLARVPLEAHLIALPKRYRLPELALPGKRKFQPGGVSLAASIGDSEEFLALRDYRPGDPLQRVHWKSFARAGKPVVKVYQDEFFERHALVLDTGGAHQELEEAVALAASFVYTMDTHECLLDLLFVGTEVRAYTAGRGQMQADHMLEVLAGVAASEQREFAALARAVLARRASVSSVIAILVAWDAERRDFIVALRASGAEVRALLVCPDGTVPADLPPGVVALHPGEIEKGLLQLR